MMIWLFFFFEIGIVLRGFEMKISCVMRMLRCESFDGDSLFLNLDFSRHLSEVCEHSVGS